MRRKALNAQFTGAEAVIVINSVLGDPATMQAFYTDAVSIPLVMVSLSVETSFK